MERLCRRVDEAGQDTCLEMTDPVNHTVRSRPLRLIVASAFDLGRCAIRHAIDDFDAGEEVEGGLAKTIKEHFEVEETGEVLAKVVSNRFHDAKHVANTALDSTILTQICPLQMLQMSASFASPTSPDPSSMLSC